MWVFCFIPIFCTINLVGEIEIEKNYGEFEEIFKEKNDEERIRDIEENKDWKVNEKDLRQSR